MTVIEELHAFIRERLFGPGPWLADIAANKEINRKLFEDWKLEVDCIGRDGRGITNTPLGNELHVDIMMVFMGHWEPWEIPEILCIRGLISVDEMRDVQDRWAARDEVETLHRQDLEEFLLPMVRRAYTAFIQAPELYAQEDWDIIRNSDHAKKMTQQLYEEMRSETEWPNA